MKGVIILLFFSGFIASGCSMYRSMIPSGPPQVPAEYAEYDGPARTTESAHELEVSTHFWQDFGDENLDRIIDETLAANLDLAKAHARLQQLEAAARSASAARLPFLNLTGQAGRERQVTSMGASTGNSMRLSLAAGYEVDLWRKVQSRTDAAGMNALASREDLRALYLSLSAQVIDLYYLIVEQRAQLALTDEIIDSCQEILDRMESRYREGLVPTLDVYQARQNILAAKVQRTRFVTALDASSHALAVLSGRFPEKSRLDETRNLPDLGNNLEPVLPALLVTRRPDIRAAWLRLRARDAAVAAAVADRFPSLNLATALGGASLDFATSASGLVWNIMVEAAQPLFDGGRRGAEIDRTRGLLNEEIANYRQTLLHAFQEVEDALSGRRATTRRLELLKERLAATEATLQLATDNYFAGVSDYLPVLTAQVNLFEVKSQLLSARRELISNRITLVRTMGGDWMDTSIDNHFQSAGK
jgi:NodT family efflux transporter outer membrane factor (OMF) lipoprotein